MKRKRQKRRKEVTHVFFKGIARDGGVVFEAQNSKDLKRNKWTSFKTSYYKKRVMEIAFNYDVAVFKVAEIVSGLFSKESNMVDLELITLNYRNIQLKVKKTSGKKDIICMLMKAMANSKCKEQENMAKVDTSICRADNPLRSSDKNIEMELFNNCFYIERKVGYRETLNFRNTIINMPLIVYSIKNGEIVASYDMKNPVNKVIEEIENMFNPYSNFYGIKSVNIKLDQLAIKIDARNSGKIQNLYEIGVFMDMYLEKRALQEYLNSARYISKCKRIQKKWNRYYEVKEKIKKFQGNVDFTFVNEKKREQWEAYKKSNLSYYQKRTIDYAILWAQYMEYLMFQYGKKISEVWEISSYFANTFDISWLEQACAADFLANLWKYGEEFREMYALKLQEAFRNQKTMYPKRLIMK